MNSKRIAGVCVNVDNLPTKESLIQKALKTKDYIYKRNALELINKEIKDSGLYRENIRKSEDTKSTEDSSGFNNTKRTKSNKNRKK